ncbi:MAG TPA: T9SS type A sorting domain-containing protein [Chitinophagales bacterium]|nr:T9SS type A sorting domain-containing protein [Chitinophagales bacterium]
MRPSLFFILSVAITQISFGQAPAIEWQNTIGGSSYEDLRSLEQTSDGGYIIGGVSTSPISGDKTEAAWPGGPNGFDFWILKLHADGTIAWQNTIGGTNDDYLYVVKETPDGGFICGGYSASGISGDKTEGSLGGKDYWVLKLDALGNIVWQNTIGGSLDDILYDIALTTDGGYLLGGYSYSSISGDKTENNMGIASTDDYWVVKLNGDGTIAWQNTIGGTSQDYLYKVLALADGGFLLGGTSYSGLNGDKTEVSMGGADYWIIKINSTGSIVWQNGIGGSSNDNFRSFGLTTDGGFIVAGDSRSLVSGDKTETNFDNVTFYSDFWILKLNSTGSIVWQNDIGSDRDDYPMDIMQTTDGGYFIAGNSVSALLGDKTEGVIGGGTIFYDFWVMKLNATGSILWQNVIGGTNYDAPYDADITDDGGFIVGGHSYSGISGDKTEANMGASYGDYWVFKLESTCTPLPEVCNGMDDDCDGLIDDGITLSISIAAGGPTSFCQGSNVVLTATHTGTSLQWKKNGANIAGATGTTYTALQTGLYTCTTTSLCGTTTSAGINVTMNKNPKATITAGGTATFCAGGSVTLTEVPSAGCTYQWYKGAAPIAGATSTTYVATTAGSYKCRVTKTATGCLKNSNAISVSVPCKEGEEIIAEELQIAVYPNPANDAVTLVLDQNLTTEIFVTNVIGETIMKLQGDSELIEMDIHQLASGVYFVHVVQNGKMQTVSFCKN